MMVAMHALLAGAGLCQPERHPSAEAGRRQPEEAVPQAAQEEPTPEASIIDILELPRAQGREQLFAIELRNAEVADVFRILAHDYRLNLLVDPRVRGTITVSFTNISLQEALEAIAASAHLTITRQGNVLKLAPHLLTKTFALKHVEAAAILEAQSEQSQNTIYDLLSEDGKVLSGAQPNSIMVLDYPDSLQQVEEFLQMADQQMASRVFKLKYLNAADLVEQTSTTSAEGESASGTSGTTSGSESQTQTTGTSSGYSSSGN